MIKEKKNFVCVFLSLGSSKSFIQKIGESKKILSSKEIIECACDEIKKLGKNFIVSSFIKSKPWGGVAKNIFVNAVCKIDVSKKTFPKGKEEKFLDILQSIEKKFGRERDENYKHWGDRTLDIDILFWGKEKISRPRLKIPHPYLWERDFVFLPLQEIISSDELDNLKK